jgi:hypothetical protein
MKKLVLVVGVSLVVGIGAFLAMNALGFRPLDAYGNDPNSNAMVVAILYFIGAVGLFGLGGNHDRTMAGRTEYAKRGVLQDKADLDLRFPYAISFAVLGAIFVALYLILNRSL